MGPFWGVNVGGASRRSRAVGRVERTKAARAPAGFARVRVQGGEREAALATLLSAALQLGLLISTAHVPMLTVPPLGSAWLGQVVT